MFMLSLLVVSILLISLYLYEVNDKGYVAISKIARHALDKCENMKGMKNRENHRTIHTENI